MRTWAKNASRSVFGTLFPDVCLGCGAFVTKQGVVCANCWSKLQFIERPYCEINGTPFTVDFGLGAVSANAIANPPHYHAARSATIHLSIARQLVTRLKYADRTDLAPWMADWMIRAGREFIDEADLVVPVPLHRWRYFSRRYNQSAELARVIAKKTSKTHCPSALLRKKPTRQQVGLNLRQRQENVRGTFIVPADQHIQIAGRTILLIDDVLTTGATVNAAAKALQKSGAAKVYVLTFSQVVPQFIEPHKISSS
ncbi:ComF family protein [Ahrensia kielensis]|uniref:ComF family protein n=1 Tax=Ahrensia kielensis TaxID=76980 RepID=UPI00037B3A9F|nr:ComF family protein [Ahrensia kielensis]